MVNPGTMALYDSGRINFTRLRRERRERVIDAMREHDVDVLIFGREPNAQYAAGVRRLHLAGTRPWGPGCVVLRDPEEVHVMSVWDDGIPPEIPHDHLYGIGWNPMNLLASVQKIEGVSSARRIGVDYMSPLFQQLLAMAAPDAQLVDAEAIMRSVRLHKTPDEVECIRTAVTIAEAALAASVDALRPGVTGKQLLAAFVGRMTDFGISTPASEGTFRATQPAVAEAPLEFARLTTDDRIDEGALVVLSGGVLYSGYEGSIARTWLCAEVRGRRASAASRDLHRRWYEVWNRVRDACRAGATGADLLDAYLAAGEAPPALPIANSVGLGCEGPIAGSALGPSFDATQRIEPGMVLAIQAYVANDAGGYFGLETLHVTEGGTELLSTMTHGPLAEVDGDG
jgi:Xaa-Pro aminopeptidase